jgi:hypothetical protein
MGAIFEPAAFLGNGLLALWVYVRFPRARPSRVAWAIAHVAISFAAFTMLPMLYRLVSRTLPNERVSVTFVLGIVMPAMCYVLLTWIWLLGVIIGRLGNGKPRGGLPVSGTAR